MASTLLLSILKRAALVSIVVLVAAPTAQATTFTIFNLDGAGEGFNDTTPRAPEGGNPGTTLGALRVNAFAQAASQWAGLLNSSVTIAVDGNFDPLFCSGGSALLGQAGPNTAHRDFIGAPVASTWFSAAEANALRGADLNPGVSDIGTAFNSSIDSGCLGGITGWYYGFDHAPPAGKLDFVPTLLHELAHGLGFLSFVDLGSGAKLVGFDDIFSTFLEDHTTGMFYPAMSDAQRVAASINTGNLHWVGANVAAMSGLLSAGKVGTHVQMYAPNPQEPGSSVSHFDTALSPNELMEPFDTGTTFQTGTEAVLKDIHWPFLVTPTPTVTPTSTAPTPTPTVTSTPTCPEIDLGSSIPIAQAGSTSGEPNVFAGSCGGGSAPERSFKFTAPFAANYVISTADAGTNYDTVLYVRDGGCGGIELPAGCNDDNPFPTSQVTVALAFGQAVSIFVDGYNGVAQGSFVLHIDASVPPTPTVTPTPAVTPTATVPTCASGPVAGCRTPAESAKASLKYKDAVGVDTKDQLQWKWSKGAVTTKAEFGTPLTTTSYLLCIYDAS